MEVKFFSYAGYLPSGRKIKGTIVAYTKEEAFSFLERKGIFVKSLKEKKAFLLKHLPLSLKELEFFFLTLSRLLESSVSIDRAVGYIIEDQPSPRLALFLYKVKVLLEEGESFSEALKKTGEVPVEVYEMIRVGEVSGKIVKVLKNVALYYKEKAELKKKILSALAYPSFVAFSSLGIVLLAPYLLKNVQKLYKGLPVQFPLYSKIVLKVSSAMVYVVPAFVFLLATSFLLFRSEYKKGGRFKELVDKTLLSVPLLSGLLVVSNFYRSFLSLLILYSSGVSIQKAVSMIIEGTSISPLKRGWQKVEEELEKGSSFSSALVQHPFVSQLIVSLLSFSEKGGFFENQLTEVVKYLKEKLDSQVGFFVSILTPLFLALVAVLVFLVLLAFYLPIFNLLSGMSKL